MKTIKTSKGIEIKIFSSARELEIRRYIEFQKYLVLDSGIGSTIEAINSRFTRIKAFIEESKTIDALTEVNNGLNACLNAINGVSYGTLAFACLVASIGGELQDDYSESGLASVIDLLADTDITIGDIEEAVEDVKKKF